MDVDNGKVGDSVGRGKVGIDAKGYSVGGNTESTITSSTAAAVYAVRLLRLG